MNTTYNSGIRVVSAPLLVKPIVEPKYKIVEAYLETVTENEENRWVLNLVNHDGQLFKYNLTISES